MDFGAKIKARRIDLGMTTEDVAKLVGVSNGTISRWETGSIKNQRRDKIELLAKALKTTPADLMGWPEKNKPQRAALSDDAHHIGVLYDRADEKDQLLTHSVLDKYDTAPVIVSTAHNNPGKMIELDVWDEPAAAGLGNYLDVPEASREQFPAVYVPAGADFAIRISGDSMEPNIVNGSTVFVRSTATVPAGKVGIFVLNGAAYCKQLIVDKAARRVALHSLNDKYDDIVIRPGDDLRTIGQVL